MKQISKSTFPNIGPCLPENPKPKDTPDPHVCLNYECQYTVTQNHQRSQFLAPPCSNVSHPSLFRVDDHLSQGHIQQPKCYITKRRLDFDCHAALSQPHAPSSNFFSLKRRRQSNLLKESGIATYVGTHNAWNASNDFTCVSNVMQDNANADHFIARDQHASSSGYCTDSHTYGLPANIEHPTSSNAENIAYDVPIANHCFQQRRLATRGPPQCHSSRVHTSGHTLNLSADLLHDVTGPGQKSTSNAAAQYLPRHQEKAAVADEPPQKHSRSHETTVFMHPVPAYDVQSLEEKTTSLLALK